MINTKTIAVSFDDLDLEDRAVAIQSAIEQAVPTNSIVSVSMIPTTARWTDEGRDGYGDYSYSRSEDGAIVVIVYHE